MTNLSTIQYIGLTSWIKNAKTPTTEYKTKAKIPPRIKLIIKVGIKTKIFKIGIPTNKHIKMLPIKLITKKENNPWPIVLQ